MYGTKGIAGIWHVALDAEGTKHLGRACDNFDTLVENVMDKVSFSTKGASP